MSSEIRISKPEEVVELARKVIARVLAAPQSGAAVIALEGELGAGKTTLAQAIARELGVTGVVQSPTFTICRRHELPAGAPFPEIFHFDLYRLAGTLDLAAVGWQEALSTPRALVIVEWPERAPGAVPQGSVWVKLRHGTTPNERLADVESQTQA